MKKLNSYLKQPTKKQFLEPDDQKTISNYFSTLANNRWSKDKRTKEERKVYFSQLAKKRWQKGKDETKK